MCFGFLQNSSSIYLIVILNLKNNSIFKKIFF